MQWDQTQTENGFCVPTSIAMVASEFAGHEIDAQTAVDEAEQLGYLTQDSSGNWSGLDINQGQDLLEHLGVPCHVENGTIDTLRQYLDEGKAIVLGDQLQRHLGPEQRRRPRAGPARSTTRS